MQINSKIISNIKNNRILVVGDVMLDKYIFGETSRISPEAPVPIVKVNLVDEKVGGAGNVAISVAKLGSQVGIIGLIGNDEESLKIKSILAINNINLNLISLKSKSTITKIRVLSNNQQIVRLDYEEFFNIKDAKYVEDEFYKEIINYDIVIFSDYLKGTLLKIKKMINKARELNKIILVDPKSSDFSSYSGSTLVTPNINEFISAGGCVLSENDILYSARNILIKNNIGAMLLTRSERGMTWITLTNHQHFKAKIREVIDVTGAGDTVIATMASFIGTGLEYEKCCSIANVAAGIAVSKRGAASISIQELLESLGSQNIDISEMDESQIIAQIIDAKNNNESIVFTNGCFDILHAGHVKFLEEARALGDRLVIGLNSDASVKRLKGSNRPINNWIDRANILKSIKWVDWVIPFGDNTNEEDSPLKLIEIINPQVLVKGSDYNVDNIIGANFIIKKGGKVKVIELLDGRSTSSILNRINIK